jgi:hypothetical protein
LRYVNLAASLQPTLSEYDLLGALTSHYPMDIQKCMISANLKSNKNAFTFLGKMQTLDDERESVKKFKQDQNQKDFDRKQNRDSEAGRNESRR